MPTFRRSPNGWAPIDPSVRRRTDPIQPASAEGALRPLRFGRDGSKLVELALDDGPVTLSSTDMSAVNPVVEATGAVRYDGVAPDTELRYRVSAGGLKEEIVLRSALAPHEFHFHLADARGQLGGLHAQPDGSYHFERRIDDDVEVGLAAPFAYELPAVVASGRGAAGVAKDPTSARMRVSRAGDGFDIALSVDEAWLAGRRFPIALDPTVTFSNSGGAMTAGFIPRSSSCPNGGGGCVPDTAGDLAIGTFTDANVDWAPARSVFRFDLSSIPPGSPVSAAALSLHTTGCLGDDSPPPGVVAYQCDTHSYTVELHQLNGTWNGASTYDDLDAVTDSASFASYGQAPFTAFSSPAPDPPSCTGCFWVSVDMAAQLQRWVNGDVANNGFVAKLSSEPPNVGGPFWDYLGPRGQNNGGPPYLQVTYEPNVPSDQETLGPGNPAEHANQCNHGPSPINCATGNFWHEFTDLAIPGRGPALALSRTYNSLDSAADGPFGFGWASSYTMSASTDQSTGVVSIRQEDGSRVDFRPAGAGFTAPGRVFASLVRDSNGTLTYTRRRRERFLFNAAGRLTAVTDLNGYTTSLAYDGSGRLATVTDPAARSISFLYAPTGKVSSVSDPVGRRLSYAYDGAGNLQEVVDVAGGHTQFTYDGAHRVLTMRAPKYFGDTSSPPRVVTNHYDASGRVDSQTDPLGRTTTFAYSAGSRTTTIVDPRGNREVQQYNGNGALATLSRGVGTSSAATWSYQYDLATLTPSAVTDPDNHTTTVAYDAAGNLTRRTDARQRTTAYAYDSLDDVTSVTDASGVATTMTYDAAGNLTSRSRPLAEAGQTQTLRYAYDPARPGDLAAVTDPLGKAWAFAYDASGDLASAADPLGDRSTYAYDALGRRTSAVSPRGNAAGADPAQFRTTYAYDPFGALTSTTDPLGRTATRHYDPNRNPDRLTDADGRTTTYAYDADDELTAVGRADGTSLGYGYDPAGNRTSQSDGAGKATAYAYDALNRVTSATDPLGRATAFGYDGAGNRTSVLDPSNRSTASSYDEANELTLVDYSDPATADVSFTYDVLGRRATMADGTGTSSYAYDSLGRLTSSGNGAGQTVRYGYDLRGQLTSIAYPGGLAVSRRYDDAQRLTAVDDGLGHTSAFAYDADGGLANEALPEGSSVSQAYDRADRLATITDVRGASTRAAFSYGRDPAGLVSSEAPALGQPAHSYQYTALDQLASADGAAYGYDGADNVTRLAPGAAQGYDAANQLASRTQAGVTVPYAFDSRGDRTGEGAPGASSAYAYDQAGRLTQFDPAHQAGPVVAGGASHTLAIRNDGTLWASGANGAGQLGNGTTAASPAPVQVPGLDRVVAVAAGDAFSLALRADGTVWAWGDNGAGQLGNGTTAASPAPVQVPGLGGVVALAAGSRHALAVRTDGTVWAWGDNSSGQLGVGTTASSPRPAQVPGLAGATAVAAGRGHSLALRSSGKVAAWGYNGDGQLGDGATNNSLSPVDVSVLAGVTAIGAGADHSLASGTGGVFAWGSNSSGQLGNGTTQSTSTPLPVVGLGSALSLAGGAAHSLAVDGSGRLFAWGDDSHLQLGTVLALAGQRTSTPVPLQAGGTVVVGNGDSAAVAAGSFHSLSLSKDHRVSAWGADGAGQLGDGGAADVPQPKPAFPYAGPEGTAAYAYDGDGLRSSKAVGASASAGSAWDVAEGSPLLLADGPARYVYGPGGLPLERIEGSAVLYYHHDQLGSTRLLTDQGGSVAATYSYDPYGRLTAIAGGEAAASNPLRYAGEYSDAETGLVYLRNRYYDPATGQFITRDPLAAVTQSPYGYAGGDPLNGTDPSGLLSLQDVIRIGKAIVKTAVGCAKGATYGGILGGAVGAGFGVPQAGVVGGLVVGCVAGGTLANLSPPGQTWFPPPPVPVASVLPVACETVPPAANQP